MEDTMLGPRLFNDEQKQQEVEIGNESKFVNK